MIVSGIQPVRFGRSRNLNIVTRRGDPDSKAVYSPDQRNPEVAVGLLVREEKNPPKQSLIPPAVPTPRVPIQMERTEQGGQKGPLRGRAKLM